METLSRRYFTAVDDLPLRIMCQFDEQPSLRLSLAQIRRLHDLSEAECRDVLNYLVGSGMLRHEADGQFRLMRLAD